MLHPLNHFTLRLNPVCEGHTQVTVIHTTMLKYVSLLLMLSNKSNDVFFLIVMLYLLNISMNIEIGFLSIPYSVLTLNKNKNTQHKKNMYVRCMFLNGNASEDN